jgi:hypothetical protein
MSTVIDGSASVTINNGAVLGITSGTAVASTSGTSIDFTGLPAWIKRVTVLGSEVSGSGTSSLLIQLGDSGGIEITGYKGGMFGNTNQTNTSTAGAVLMQTSNSASSNHSFSIVFSSENANKWIASGVTTRDDGAVFFTASFKSLSATLDRVRITTVNGTDTFDAGSVNILYEG